MTQRAYFFPDPVYWTALYYLPPVQFSISVEDGTVCIEVEAHDLFICFDQKTQVVTACWEGDDGTEHEFAQRAVNAGAFRHAIYSLVSRIRRSVDSGPFSEQSVPAAS